MKKYLFDQKRAKKELRSFFKNEKATINSFGSTVNQTFEAQVFALVVKWYINDNWNVRIVNPFGNELRLKFSTRGAPKGYSYAVCKKNGESCQIRHQLRVSTKFEKVNRKKPANICCDVVVMNDINIDRYKTDNSLPNDSLITFGEVKHMPAFAELVAGFIGLVHELSPGRLKRIRTKSWKQDVHLSPFLYVSGVMLNTAKGLYETIQNRKFDIDIFSFESPMTNQRQGDAPENTLNDQKILADQIDF